jgi:hypothetical protein
MPQLLRLHMMSVVVPLKVIVPQPMVDYRLHRADDEPLVKHMHGTAGNK